MYKTDPGCVDVGLQTMARPNSEVVRNVIFILYLNVIRKVIQLR